METLVLQESLQESPAPAQVQPKHKSGMKRAIQVSGVSMALLLPIGIFPRIMQNQELSNEAQLQEKLPAVSVALATAADQTHKLSLPGTVEAIVSTPIYGRADGYIKKRYADIGDRVKTGQLLAEVQTPELDDNVKEANALVLTSVATRAQAEASLDQAKADMTTAQADLAQAKATLLQSKSQEKFARDSQARWLALVKEGAVSKQDFDQRDTAYSSSQSVTAAAEAKVRSVESQLVAAKARINADQAFINVSDANIDAAKARQSHSATEVGFNKIVAPFDGVITERNIDDGTLVTSGSENSKMVLYQLSRIDIVKVFVDVPQYASTNVKVGQNVSVTLKERPGRVFSGKVERTSVALDANARTLKTEIHIANKDLELAPGMYADVNFTVPRPEQALLIPTNSVMTDADGQRVLVVANNSVHYRKVQVGDDLGKEVEVLSGLRKKDRVVVNPADSLQDGARVTIQEN